MCIFEICGQIRISINRFVNAVLANADGPESHPQRVTSLLATSAAQLLLRLISLIVALANVVVLRHLLFRLLLLEREAVCALAAAELRSSFVDAGCTDNFMVGYLTSGHVSAVFPCCSLFSSASSPKRSTRESRQASAMAAPGYGYGAPPGHAPPGHAPPGYGSPAPGYGAPPGHAPPGYGAPAPAAAPGGWPPAPARPAFSYAGYVPSNPRAYRCVKTRRTAANTTACNSHLYRNYASIHGTLSHGSPAALCRSSCSLFVAVDTDRSGSVNARELQAALSSGGMV